MRMINGKASRVKIYMCMINGKASRVKIYMCMSTGKASRVHITHVHDEKAVSLARSEYPNAARVSMFTLLTAARRAEEIAWTAPLSTIPLFAKKTVRNGHGVHKQ
jgi:hypothetical protein